MARGEETGRHPNRQVGKSYLNRHATGYFIGVNPAGGAPFKAHQSAPTNDDSATPQLSESVIAQRDAARKASQVKRVQQVVGMTGSDRSSIESAFAQTTNPNALEHQLYRGMFARQRKWQPK